MEWYLSNQLQVEESLQVAIMLWMPWREAIEVAPHLAALAGSARKVLALLQSEMYLRAAAEFVRPSVVVNHGPLLSNLTAVQLAERVGILRRRALRIVDGLRPAGLWQLAGDHVENNQAVPCPVPNFDSQEEQDGAVDRVHRALEGRYPMWGFVIAQRLVNEAASLVGVDALRGNRAFLFACADEANTRCRTLWNGDLRTEEEEDEAVEVLEVLRDQAGARREAQACA
eukprot:14237191-Alexandrium_andersonii.AAC.1